MEVIKKTEDGKLTLTVKGSIDTITAPQLEGEIKTDGLKELVIDLTEVTYVSSAGLRVFLMAHKNMLKAGGRMTIAQPQPAVKNVFDLTGFSKILTIV